jgi:hypothetical protein
MSQLHLRATVPGVNTSRGIERSEAKPLKRRLWGREQGGNFCHADKRHKFWLMVGQCCMTPGDHMRDLQ